MSMIPCPNQQCGRDIASTAKRCPHCGAVVHGIYRVLVGAAVRGAERQEKGKPKFDLGLWIINTLGGVIIVVMLVLVFRFCR